MDSEKRRPSLTVFAGPNGSGKSTVKAASPHVIRPYINADEIKDALGCNDLRAAELADERREKCLSEQIDFSFETVLSTRRKLDFLSRARERGYFIRGIFVLTVDPEINVLRVRSRVLAGGHDVPAEKIRSRYTRSLANLPEFIALCDVCHVYDNSGELFRIFKKRNDVYSLWANEFWTEGQIEKLVGFR